MAFTLLLKNNASRAEYAVRGLIDEGTDLLHLFKDFTMPEGAQSGEYTYALFTDNAADSVYNLNDSLLESTVTVADKTVAVKHLNPEVGILSYEEREDKVEYLQNNTENRFYRKK